jgi:hypothetical protein
MADRILKDITVIRDIPMYGRCSRCGRPFRMPPEAMDNPEKAKQDFLAAFNLHECDQDASQAAARVVREATEDH